MNIIIFSSAIANYISTHLFYKVINLRYSIYNKLFRKSAKIFFDILHNNSEKYFG